MASTSENYIAKKLKEAKFQIEDSIQKENKSSKQNKIRKKNITKEEGSSEYDENQFFIRE
jgi:hypothetical protein